MEKKRMQNNITRI